MTSSCIRNEIVKMRKSEHNRRVGKESREIQKLKCLLAVATESRSKKVKKFL